MTEIIEYKLLMDSGAFGLQEKVNEAIEQGYHLYGDPNISVIDNSKSHAITVRCIQAVVKYAVPTYDEVKEKGMTVYPDEIK